MSRFCDSLSPCGRVSAPLVTTLRVCAFRKFSDDVTPLHLRPCRFPGPFHRSRIRSLSLCICDGTLRISAQTCQKRRAEFSLEFSDRSPEPLEKPRMTPASTPGASILTSPTQVVPAFPLPPSVFAFRLPASVRAFAAVGGHVAIFSVTYGTYALFDFGHGARIYRRRNGQLQQALTSEQIMSQ